MKGREEGREGREEGEKGRREGGGGEGRKGGRKERKEGMKRKRSGREGRGVEGEIGEGGNDMHGLSPNIAFLLPWSLFGISIIVRHGVTFATLWGLSSG